jgi:hypothetical protein
LETVNEESTEHLEESDHEEEEEEEEEEGRRSQHQNETTSQPNAEIDVQQIVSHALDEERPSISQQQHRLTTSHRAEEHGLKIDN